MSVGPKNHSNDLILTLNIDVSDFPKFLFQQCEPQRAEGEGEIAFIKYLIY